MADWGSPVSGVAYGPEYASALVVPSATANTKGPWTDLYTPVKSGQLKLFVDYGGNFSNHRTMLFDFAIGSSGNEKVFLNNLMGSFPNAMSYTNSRTHVFEVNIPLLLPANTLIRARAQSSEANSTGAYLFSKSYNTPNAWAGSIITTYGSDVSASAGTTAANGVSAPAFGPFVTLTAACERVECFFLVVGARNPQTPAQNYGEWNIAIGAAGAEQVIAHGVVESSSSTQTVTPVVFGPYYHPISKGQRISVRCWRASNETTRYLDFTLYGVS